MVSYRIVSPSYNIKNGNMVEISLLHKFNPINS